MIRVQITVERPYQEKVEVERESLISSISDATEELASIVEREAQTASAQIVAALRAAR